MTVENGVQIAPRHLALGCPLQNLQKKFDLFEDLQKNLRKFSADTLPCLEYKHPPYIHGDPALGSIRIYDLTQRHLLSGVQIFIRDSQIAKMKFKKG